MNRVQAADPAVEGESQVDKGQALALKARQTNAVRAMVCDKKMMYVDDKIADYISNENPELAAEASLGEAANLGELNLDSIKQLSSKDIIARISLDDQPIQPCSDATGSFEHLLPLEFNRRLNEQGQKLKKIPVQKVLEGVTIEDEPVPVEAEVVEQVDAQLTDAQATAEGADPAESEAAASMTGKAANSIAGTATTAAGASPQLNGDIDDPFAAALADDPEASAEDAAAAVLQKQQQDEEDLALAGVDVEVENKQGGDEDVPMAPADASESKSVAAPSEPKAPIVNKDAEDLQKKQVVWSNEYPYACPRVACMFAAKMRGCDLNKIDFLLGGSALNFFAKQQNFDDQAAQQNKGKGGKGGKGFGKGNGKNAGNSAVEDDAVCVVQRYRNLITVTKAKHYRVTGGDIGLQFERIITGGNEMRDVVDVEQPRYEFLNHLEIAGMQVLCSAESDALGSTRPIEIKMSRSFNIGTNSKYLQLVSNGASELIHLAEREKGTSSRLRTLDRVTRRPLEEVVELTEQWARGRDENNIIHTMNQLQDFFFGQENASKGNPALDDVKWNDGEVYVLRFATGHGNRYDRTGGDPIELLPANQLAADRMSVLKSQGSSKVKYLTQRNIPKIPKAEIMDSCLAPSVEVASELLDTLDEDFSYATADSKEGLIKPTVNGIVIEDFFDDDKDASEDAVIEDGPPAAKRRRMAITVGSDAFVAGVEVAITHGLKI